MTKTKIGAGYWQLGYGRGLNKTASVYLINGYLYARDLKGWRISAEKLPGELEGFIRVNAIDMIEKESYRQVYESQHKPYSEK